MLREEREGKKEEECETLRPLDDEPSFGAVPVRICPVCVRVYMYPEAHNNSSASCCWNKQECGRNE